MPSVRDGSLVFDSHEQQPMFAVEMADADGVVRLIPVLFEATGFTSDRPFIHVTHASVMVGRTVIIDKKTKERIVADEKGYRPWNPTEARAKHATSMELT